MKIIDIFFKLASETDSLPQDCDRETIDAFLTSIVALMNQNIGTPLAVKGLEILFKFLKNGKLKDIIITIAKAFNTFYLCRLSHF